MKMNVGKKAHLSVHICSIALYGSCQEAVVNLCAAGIKKMERKCCYEKIRTAQTGAQKSTKEGNKMRAGFI